MNTALAFDHHHIIMATHERLQRESLTSSELLKLLGEPFRTRHARFLYRPALGDRVSPRALRRGYVKSDLVERTGARLV